MQPSKVVAKGLPCLLTFARSSPYLLELFRRAILTSSQQATKEYTCQNLLESNQHGNYVQQLEQQQQYEKQKWQSWKIALVGFAASMVLSGRLQPALCESPSKLQTEEDVMNCWQRTQEKLQKSGVKVGGSPNVYSSLNGVVSIEIPIGGNADPYGVVGQAYQIMRSQRGNQSIVQYQRQESSSESRHNVGSSGEMQVEVQIPRGNSTPKQPVLKISLHNNSGLSDFDAAILELLMEAANTAQRDKMLPGWGGERAGGFSSEPDIFREMENVMRGFGLFGRFFGDLQDGGFGDAFQHGSPFGGSPFGGSFGGMVDDGGFSGRPDMGPPAQFGFPGQPPAQFTDDQNRSKHSIKGKSGSDYDYGSPQANQIVKQLESMGARVFPPKQDEELDWDIIAGYEKQKRQIEDGMLLALKNPEVYDKVAKGTRKKFQSNRPRAVLFEGPPGTGKTTSARVMAQMASVPLVYVPLESIMSKWYGESEKLLGNVFKFAENLGGAIIFFDEIDSLAGNREEGMHEASRRVLSVLLRFIDGFDTEKKTVVIGATNRKQDLDAAMISRFDAIVTFDLPDAACRSDILKQYAQHLNENEFQKLGQSTAGFSGRDLRDICEEAERKWASKIIRGELTEKQKESLPPIGEYMESIQQRRVGAANAADMEKHYTIA